MKPVIDISKEQQKFEMELKDLKNELIFIESLPESVYKEFNYNFNKILNRMSKIHSEKLDSEDAEAYRLIYDEHNGIKKEYIYIFKGASIVISTLSSKKEYISSTTKDKDIKLIDVIYAGDTIKINAQEDMLIKKYTMLK